jgi:hypothetical protein
VIEYDGVCAGVEIYSCGNAAWIYNESKWGEHTNVTFYRSPSLFLNVCLHNMGQFGEYSMILAVDMEGNIWREIGRTSCLQHSMHQAQGHLCVCIVASPNDSKLSI